MEGKGKRDIGHGKLEQHIHEVLQGIDSDMVGEKNARFQVILNCKLIRNCKMVVIWLEGVQKRKRFIVEIYIVESERRRPERRFFLLILTSIFTFVGYSKS